MDHEREMLVDSIIGHQRIEHLAEGVTLYLGDCRSILPTVGNVDAVVTDPPYGEENFRSVVLPAVDIAISVADRAAIFTGTRRLNEYPPPRDIGGITCPNGGGRSAWGFGCYHPVAFYGSSPYMQAGLGARRTATVIYHPGMHVTGENVGNDHPCPKPIAFMEWLIALAALPGHTILDPFMGSGTTGVAAVKLGRKFTGIEIEPKYFDIACRRISEALKQPDMFIEKPKPATQVSFADLWKAHYWNEEGTAPA
jgi:predicted RNA methylase